jgi:hypothetical protein
MSTPFKARASRANSALSTGLRTDAGKAHSSQNALTHGMTSSSALLPGESPQQWQEHREGVLMALGAKGALETALADRIALTLWRLRRLVACDAATASDVLPAEGVSAEQADRINLVMRYEAHISRQMLQAMRALDRLQIIRNRLPALLQFEVEDTIELFNKMVDARMKAKERKRSTMKDNE